MDIKCILVTGSAGFIGSALSKYLLQKGYKVIGIDNINKSSDIKLKRDRLQTINEKSDLRKNWLFYNLSIENKEEINRCFEENRPSIVINLAAEAGVRNSILNPSLYLQSNITGFGNILEACKQYSIKHLIFASSSSVYGGNENLPYKEEDRVDHPVSLYAATKRSNELMAHTYSHLYNLPTTGLRFFTVYGPWGRPDMAPMIFTKSIFNKEPIKIFNNGKMMRDFTYIDDIVEAIYRCCEKPAKANPNFSRLSTRPDSSFAPYKVFNIGKGVPIKLLDYINILENTIGIKAIKEYEPMQLGDVKSTAASTSKLQEWINYVPNINISEGTKLFIDWYKKYYF